MIIGKKKRDVKFIIYQSLYILVIAMLGAKHVTINDIPPPLPPDSEIISKARLDSLLTELELHRNKITYNKETEIVLPKLENDSDRYEIATIEDTVINKSVIQNMQNQIAELERRKTPVQVRTPTTTPIPKPKIKGIRPQ